MEDRDWKNVLDTMMGFSYKRTQDVYEAEDLCSQIMLEILKSESKADKVDNFEAYCFGIARKVYVDFCKKRKRERDVFLSGGEELFAQIPDDSQYSTDESESLEEIFAGVRSLAQSYRDVMVGYYLDGKSIEYLANEQGTSTTAIRQRLFQSRKDVRNEVEKMDAMKKPIGFERIELALCGVGDPTWSDPRAVLNRQLPKHIMWSCREKAKTAKEIASELGVPMMYVEEELEFLQYGQNGKYGALQKTNNEKYRPDILLLDVKQRKHVASIYDAHLDAICDVVMNYIADHKTGFISAPYLNHEISENLVFWTHSFYMANLVRELVGQELNEKFLKSNLNQERPFNLYGYQYDGSRDGAGVDEITAMDICGVTSVKISNIYHAFLKAHFHCGHNISKDRKLQLTIKAIKGLPVSRLNEEDKEQAARAIQEGYIMKEGDYLYTRILVYCKKDLDRVLLFYRDELAKLLAPVSERIAKDLFAFIKKEIPEYLLSESVYVNDIAAEPVVNRIISAFLEKGLLKKPSGELGPEGVVMEIVEMDSDM